jgi:hypothetical protein
LTCGFAVPILVGRKEDMMADIIQIGDERRLQGMDGTLPEPPEHTGEIEESDQPEPEEVSDAVLDQ